MSARSISFELLQVRKKIYSGIKQGLIAEGRAILEKADALVPEDSGNLRESRNLVLLEDGKNVSNLSVIMAYGNRTTEDYAVVVHETPSGFDPPTWQGEEVKFTRGGAKFLERPLMEAEKGMAERIAAKVKL